MLHTLTGPGVVAVHMQRRAGASESLLLYVANASEPRLLCVIDLAR